MKKLSLLLALVLAVSSLSAVAVSAHFDGMKEPEYYCMPKVNPSNPAIKIDGKLDFENGEWNGALKYTMDYTVSDDNERLYDWTIWSPEVWSSDKFSLVSPDELPENWQPVFDNYFMWDGDGVYMATTYKTKLHPDVTNAARNADFFDYYLFETKEDYAFGLPANIQHMLLPTDDPSAYIGTEGKWIYVFPTDDQTESWFENYTLYSSASESELVADMKAVGYTDPNPDADGYYTTTYELFTPWSFLNLDNYEEADTTMFDFYGEEGVVVQIGLITRLRNTPDAEDIDNLPYIQYTDSKGWANYNYYVLSPKAAAYNGEISFWEADVNNQTKPGEEDAGYAAYVAAAAEAAAAAPAPAAEPEPVEEAPAAEPVEEAPVVEEPVVEEAPAAEPVEEEAPAEEAVEEVVAVEEDVEAAVAAEALPAAPQTFDAALIAAVAAIVSAAGYAISKKR